MPPTGLPIESAPSSAKRPGGKLRQRRLRRSQRLFDFDRGLDHRFVAGADEAGRGCLAGPLVAAAVLFDYKRLSVGDRRILGGIHDSKQMTEEARIEMFPCVLRAAARVSIVVRSAPGIDRRGLHVTNCEALGDALARLEPSAETICLVDGFRLPRCEVPHRRVVGGDRTSAAIAAASVLAKVTRDRYMREAAERHPGWGFEEHVGYSTPEHRAAIERIGISSLHRRSFMSVAYSQLELGLSKQVEDAGSVACAGTRATEELAPRARTAPTGRSMRRSDEFELEGSGEVLEIDDFVVGAEDDADGVEADLGVARN